MPRYRLKIEGYIIVEAKSKKDAKTQAEKDDIAKFRDAARATLRCTSVEKSTPKQTEGKMRATVISPVQDCPTPIELFDAPVCKYLQMLQGCIGVPKHSIVIKSKHMTNAGLKPSIRVLGTISGKTRCLRAKSLESTIGGPDRGDPPRHDTQANRCLGNLTCRVIQANETFEITVHEL